MRLESATRRVRRIAPRPRSSRATDESLRVQRLVGALLGTPRPPRLDVSAVVSDEAAGLKVSTLRCLRCHVGSGDEQAVLDVRNRTRSLHQLSMEAGTSRASDFSW